MGGENQGDVTPSPKWREPLLGAGRCRQASPLSCAQAGAGSRRSFRRSAYGVGTLSELCAREHPLRRNCCRRLWELLPFGLEASAPPHKRRGSASRRPPQPYKLDRRGQDGEAGPEGHGPTANKSTRGIAEMLAFPRAAEAAPRSARRACFANHRATLTRGRDLLNRLMPLSLGILAARHALIDFRDSSMHTNFCDFLSQFSQKKSTER